MTAAKDTPRLPIVEINGQKLKILHEPQLAAVRIERALGLVGRATIRFNDADGIISTDAAYAIGHPVKIKIAPATEIFSGTIVGRSFDHVTARIPELTIVADDDAYKLTRGTKTVTHLETTYTRCVQQVLQKAGVKAKITGSSRGSIPYLLQAGSDLSFVDNIASRIGFVWWVDQGTFHFEPIGTSSGAVTLDYLDDIREFSLRASALRPSEVKVSGWSSDSQQKVTGQVKKSTAAWVNPPDFVRPYVTKALPGKATSGSGEPSPADKGEAQAAAQAMFDESVAGSVVAKGKVWADAKIKPAVTINLTKAGPATGKYHVTEVTHDWDRRGFYTRFTAGPVRPAGLVDLLGKPQPDPGFAIQGLVVGVITNNADPTNSGRVKVKYAGIPDDVESAWARVLSTSGGKNRGMVFLPEVDDEVVVGFEGNDARRPVVLGALFSKQNKLPEATKLLAGGKVNYRRITSRTGHIIEFADGLAPTTQHVLIKLGTAEHSIRLGADELTIEVGAGKPVTIKAGMAKFAISNSGDVTIDGTNVTIKATAQLNLEGVTSTLKGTGQVQVEGAQVDVKAQAMANVEAGGPLSLKGITVAVN